MKKLIIISSLLFSACKTYEKSDLLSRTNKGDYEIQVWDVKKYDRKTDTLIYHRVDTIIRTKIDESNLIMTNSMNTSLNPTK